MLSATKCKKEASENICSPSDLEVWMTRESGSTYQVVFFEACQGLWPSNNLDRGYSYCQYVTA